MKQRVQTPKRYPAINQYMEQELPSTSDADESDPSHFPNVVPYFVAKGYEGGQARITTSSFGPQSGQDSYGLEQSR
jgi:hypothetical protein